MVSTRAAVGPGGVCRVKAPKGTLGEEGSGARRNSHVAGSGVAW